MGEWSKNWDNDRQWKFHINQNATIINRIHDNGTVTTFRLQRKTRNPHQIFSLDETTNNKILRSLPVTPSKITMTKILIKKTYDTQLKPEISQHTNHINTPQPHIHLIDCSDHSNTTTHIGIHSTHEYELQRFTWITADDNKLILHQGPTQTTQSPHYSPSRGGLIGILQALQHNNDYLHQQKLQRKTVPSKYTASTQNP
jgi:hypothetical protein